MPKARITFRDDNAPHQIRLFTMGGDGQVHVSCTCRVVLTRFGHSQYEPMGVVPAGQSAFTIYDKPENHVVNKGVEFNPGDRTKQEMFYVD